jgi:hypothetical protein
VRVSIRKGVVVALACGAFTSVSAQAPAGNSWRTIDTWAVNGLRVRIDVSSSRTLRLTSGVGDSSATVSPELSASDVSSWISRTAPLVARASANEFIFPDAVGIGPYPSAADFRAYSVTFADTSGRWVATRTTPGELALFMNGLNEAALAATLFTDDELRRDGPVVRTAAEVDGDRPMEYPGSTCLEGDGFAQLSFQIDSTGKVDPKSSHVDLTTADSYGFVATYNLVRMHFKPATLEGHKVASMMTYMFKMHPPVNTAITVISTGSVDFVRIPADQLNTHQSIGCSRR